MWIASRGSSKRHPRLLTLFFAKICDALDGQDAAGDIGSFLFDHVEDSCHSHATHGLSFGAPWDILASSYPTVARRSSCRNQGHPLETQVMHPPKIQPSLEFTPRLGGAFSRTDLHGIQPAGESHSTSRGDTPLGFLVALFWVVLFFKMILGHALSVVRFFL